MQCHSGECTIRSSGAIGRPLIDQLLAAGHEVTALARSEDKAAGLRGRGVQAAIADAWSKWSSREAIRNLPEAPPSS